MSLRFFEIGLGCLIAAILNFMFGYWIDVVLMVVGILAITFSLLEAYRRNQPPTTPRA